MGRLPGFDYRRPFFYMVTLKKLPGLAEFSRIVSTDTPPADGRYLEATPLSVPFARTIRGFAGTWRGIAPIECFAIMPDHIHLLIRILDTPDRLALGKYVYQLEKALAREYWERADGTALAKLRADGTALAKHRADGTALAKLRPDGTGLARLRPDGTGRARVRPDGAGRARLRADGTGLARLRADGTGPRLAPPAPIFEKDWHDWIVKKDGQLATFTRYIRENGERSWRRRQNRRYFTTVRQISFAGRLWHAYGNTDILNLPVLEPFRCSRSWAKDGEEWREALGRAARIGPGGAGVGTFLSPCEKACGNAIFSAGGSFIVLTPDGFPPRWHPTRDREALCAEGRMLFLSLYEPQTARLDKATMYRRCHEMGDLIGRMVPPLQDTGRMVPPQQDSGRTVPPLQDSKENER